MGVEVPDELREAVARAVWRDARRRQLVDGGAALSPALLAFMEALRDAPVGPSAEPETSTSSARGSDVPVPVRLVSTQDVAQLLECSTRWAREVIKRAGGWKQGRDWVVDQAALDLERFGDTA